MARTDSSSKRKKIKGNRKKKTRRNKSKRLRHSDDSLSSCSDDESRSLSLDLSSSSEGEYRRKSKRGRGRSRSRYEVKGSKKRSRRRSLSEGSEEDEDEDTPPVKKRKKSKKDKKTKKKNKKKKLRRDDYVSSASSDSRSCSTCKDEDGSSDEVGSHGMSRGMSKEKKEVHRGSTKGRIGNKKKRSKSWSSFSPTRSYGSESIEKVMTENNPVRLKSVIIVANLENKEEEDMKHDELKEENVYDYDDYPSSKSNDSIELVDRFTTSPEKTSVVKEVNSSVNLNDGKEKESSASGNTGLEVDNLELILRQKALENLSKFRSGSKTKPVVAKPKSNQSVVTQPTHETVSMNSVSKPVTDRSRFIWRRDPSVVTRGKIDEKVATNSEPHSSGSQPAELKLQSENISSTSKVDNKFVDETSKVLVDTNNVDQKSTAVVETLSSASIKEGSSNEQHVEGNDNSQFKKKTMSVMRGGEMVEVSYKVYIPNRAPALARRQLKR